MASPNAETGQVTLPDADLLCSVHHLETRRVTLAGITRHPTESWMVQMARNAKDAMDGVFRPIRYVLHDRDTKFCASFRATLSSGGVEPVLLPARSPNLNAFAERWVRSVKTECLSKLPVRRSLSAARQHSVPGALITLNGTTKAWATFYSSLLPASTEPVTEQPYVVESVLAGCSNSIAARRESFDRTGRRHARDANGNVGTQTLYVQAQQQRPQFTEPGFPLV